MNADQSERAAEEWRHLVAWPNYEASDRGRVRRISSGLIKKGTLNPDGYFTMKLCHGGRSEVRLVHTLVCTAFHGSPPDKATSGRTLGRKQDE